MSISSATKPSKSMFLATILPTYSHTSIKIKRLVGNWLLNEVSWHLNQSRMSDSQQQCPISCSYREGQLPSWSFRPLAHLSINFFPALKLSVKLFLHPLHTNNCLKNTFLSSTSALVPRNKWWKQTSFKNSGSEVSGDCVIIYLSFSCRIYSFSHSLQWELGGL